MTSPINFLDQIVWGNTVRSWVIALGTCLGVAVGLRLLLDDVPPTVRASDPEAPLMFMAGPLAGTAAPSSSRSSTPSPAAVSRILMRLASC